MGYYTSLIVFVAIAVFFGLLLRAVGFYEWYFDFWYGR